MAEVLSAVAWPVVGLILGLVFLLKFRAELASLIGRTQKFGKGLVDFEGQQAQPKDDHKAVEEFLKTFDNPMVVENEKLILKGLEEKKITNPEDREKALLRSLAATGVVLHFERAHSSIWASQLGGLHFLNPRAEGADVSELVPFYDQAKAQFPPLYENYTFAQWLGFLELQSLIAKKDTRVYISVAGREFLKYLVAAARVGPYYG